MIFDFNTFNKPYPAEEFLEDVKGVENSILNKVKEKPKNFKLDMGDGEIREYKFNTESPLFKASQYFSEKYGSEEGARRHLRFRCIFDFVFKNENLLIQNGLAKRENGEVFYRGDFNDFLSFLLTFKVKPTEGKDGEIPRKAIKLYLRSI